MANNMTRRAFSAGIVTAGAMGWTASSARARSGANERVRLGLIGVGSRGDKVLEAFLTHKDMEIAALCDVYSPYLDFARSKVDGHPFITKDYRHLLDRKDIDAVVIASPDHWHALQTIDACAAGKDVYIEKPLSLVVSEGRKMIEAARKYNRITQMGVHRRSASHCQEAIELIQNGAIGKVTSCRCVHLTNEWPMGIGNPPDSNPPAGLDWDMWLGPARKVPYNKNRCFYKFRWFRDYSGGQLTNFGTHWLDLIQWAIRQDAPVGVFATGVKGTIKDNREIPDTLEAVWEYADGTLVTFTQSNANAASGNAKDAWVEFRGTEGTVYITYKKIEIVPEAVRLEPVPAQNPLDRKEASRQGRATTRPAGVARLLQQKGNALIDHTRNFLDGVKTRKPCNCPVEIGHQSTVATLIANVAYDRKRHLTWNAKQEKFTNDPEANALLSYEYRSPWRLP